MIPVGKVEASSISEVHGDEVLLPANISDVEGAIVTTNIEDVGDLLSQDDIDEVTFINPELIAEKYENETVQDTSEISQRLGITKYRVRGVKNASDVTGTTAIAATQGGPGVTLKIDQVKSVSTTVSAKYGASNKIISAEVGWSVTGSSSISISGSFKVPSKSGGKSVRSCKLSAYPLRRRKSFIVDKMAWNSIKWEKQGTGYVSKAYGITFKKSYQYK